MRVAIAIATLAALVAVASCTGKGQNTVDIFSVRSGQVTLTAEVPEGSSTEISAVEFRVDGGPISTDSQGPEWSATFDTTKVADGVHYITAVGNPGSGEVVLLENSVIVRNGGAAAPAAGGGAVAPPAQFKKTN